MRAIDADKLMRLRYTHIIQFWEGKLIKSLPLSEVPTITYADLVPHRRWRNLGCDEYVCSECGFYCEYPSVRECGYNYCPNCGAKMDGGKEK